MQRGQSLHLENTRHKLRAESDTRRTRCSSYVVWNFQIHDRLFSYRIFVHHNTIRHGIEFDGYTISVYRSFLNYQFCLLLRPDSRVYGQIIQENTNDEFAKLHPAFISNGAYSRDERFSSGSVSHRTTIFMVHPVRSHQEKICVLRELLGLLYLHVSIYHASDYIFTRKALQTRNLYKRCIYVFSTLVNSRMYIHYNLSRELDGEHTRTARTTRLRLEARYSNARSSQLLHLFLH